VLSGAKLINRREFRDGLVRRFPSAIGGEMEGVGAYAAAFRHRVPVLLVKAICDWADGTKEDRAQPFAAFTAVDLVRHVLTKPDALAALGIEARA
jgi:nucleoside phosphorylase